MKNEPSEPEKPIFIEPDGTFEIPLYVTYARRPEKWNQANAAFLDEYIKLIEKDGPALSDFRTF